jgi:hypothetical protein
MKNFRMAFRTRDGRRCFRQLVRLPAIGGATCHAERRMLKKR